jgi:F0F1-type ATP synthase membrane subunit b/b'
MELMIEYNIVGVIVIFLLLIVLGMQIQMNIMGRRIEEKEEYISGKIEELLKKKISQLLRNK